MIASSVLFPMRKFKWNCLALCDWTACGPTSALATAQDPLVEVPLCFWFEITFALGVLFVLSLFYVWGVFPKI